MTGNRTSQPPSRRSWVRQIPRRDSMAPMLTLHNGKDRFLKHPAAFKARSPGFLICHHLLKTLLDLRWLKVLGMRSDCPYMSEGIAQRPGSITVELVLDGADLLATGIDRALENLIDIFDIDGESNGCTQVPADSACPIQGWHRPASLASFQP